MSTRRGLDQSWAVAPQKKKIAQLTKLSQFEEYLGKQGKIQIHKTMKTNSRHNSHKRCSSTEFRLTQKYVNARCVS
jgi:hypothetical protein